MDKPTPPKLTVTRAPLSELTIEWNHNPADLDVFFTGAPRVRHQCQRCQHVPCGDASPVRDPESDPLQTKPGASAYLDRVRLFSHHPGPALLTITAEWDDAEVAEWQAQDALERKADIEFPGWRKRRMVDDSTFSLRRLVVEFEPGRSE